MAKVLTTASTVVCGHGGTATVSSSAKLTVQGQKVLLADGPPSWTIAVGCSQTNTNNSEKPCTKIASVTAGKSSKLTVGGVKVLLDSLGGVTDGAPKNTDLSATAGQNKLESV